jgi:preprotein translocase subunit YajC
MGSLWTLIPLIGIFYFFLIMPEQKKQKKIKEMMNNLKVGDDVFTRGGIFGTIVTLDENMVTLATGPDKVKISVTRGGIGSIAQSVPEEDKKTLELEDIQKNEDPIE